MKRISIRQTVPCLTRCALACVAVMLSCVSFTAVGQNAQPDAGRIRFREQVRRVVEGEIRFAPNGASAEAVRESIESLSGFVERRSSARLSEGSQLKLTSMEQAVGSGNTRLVSIEDVTQAVTTSIMEIAAGLSDAQIINLAEAYRDKGDSRGAIILRSSGEGYMKTKDFISRLKSLRSLGQRDKNLLKVVRNAVRSQVQDRAQYLSEAMPETFGGVLKIGMTPVQAFLIIYSVASDDLMNFTVPELMADIESRRQGSTSSGMSTPATTAATATVPGKAYGTGGSFYATPFDVIFNDEVIGKLLNRLTGKVSIAR